MQSLLNISAVTFLLLFNNIFLFSQDNSDPRWRIDPSTRVQVLGNYVPLPQKQLPNINQNTTMKIYHTPDGDVIVPPNIRPLPNSITQSEIDAVTMQGNQNVMWAAWNSYGPPFYGTGFCFTSNGGTTWSGNYQMIVPNNSGDPGPWIWPAGSTWASRLGLSVLGSGGISTTYSDDNGATWHQFIGGGGTNVDKNFSAVDDVPGSLFFGRAYTVWTDFAGANAYRIVGAFTSNGGVTWTGYQPVSPVPAAGHHNQGCDIEVGPGGVVYVVWAHCITNGQNSTEDNLGFAKSTDGGATWINSSNNVVDINGIRALNLYNGVRVNGFPRIAVDKSGGVRNGWIYVMLSEKILAPARDLSDICMARSTDGGTTWAHTLVNSDGYGNYNWLPAVTVDNNGILAVSYYDTRNLIVPATQFYMSFSTNGGNLFSDVLVSDHTFTPAPIPGLAGGYQGDYTGITWGNGKMWPFWADNSSGLYQCWTVGVIPQVLTHDISCGPFLNLPGPISTNTTVNMKTKVSNVGLSNETGIPIKWFINGTLTNTSNINLNSGQVDSVNNSWTPTTPGTFQLMYIASLATDQYHTNDTTRLTATVVTVLPPFCEDFNGPFPPAGWMCNGCMYWSGGGSAKYDMWNAPAGTNEALITLTFPITGAGDSLYINMAYQPFSTTQDSLIILASTNGGSSYISVVRLGPSQMQTTSGNPSPFVPTASQWAKRSYSLQAGTNKIQFLGKSGFGDNLYIDSTCIRSPLGIVPVSSGIPEKYFLSQNYPNPFNPSTVITYSIPLSRGVSAGRGVFVSLKVYDILGREVETLVNEYKQAGSYKADFDGSSLASGVYFYRLESADFVNTKKMLMIK